MSSVCFFSKAPYSPSLAPSFLVVKALGLCNFTSSLQHIISVKQVVTAASLYMQMNSNTEI